MMSQFVKVYFFQILQQFILESSQIRFTFFVIQNERSQLIDILQIILMNNDSRVLFIEIKFDRSSCTYKPQENVSGWVSLSYENSTSFEIDVSSISFIVKGVVNSHSKAKSKKMDQSAAKVERITILNLSEMNIAKNKTIKPDTKIPFRFKLEKGQHPYLQSYFGVYISITYAIEATVKLQKGGLVLEKEQSFYIQVPKAGRNAIDVFDYPKKRTFMLRTDDVKNDQIKVPNFKIRGELYSQICFFNEDLYGQIIIDVAESPIRSIDLQMLRVQTIQTQGCTSSEKTQIQLIQICDGNVTKNIPIPLYMILPRYYSCPSVKYKWCQVDFECTLVIIFKEGFKVTANLPLKLIRS